MQKQEMIDALQALARKHIEDLAAIQRTIAILSAELPAPTETKPSSPPRKATEKKARPQGTKKKAYVEGQNAEDAKPSDEADGGQTYDVEGCVVTLHNETSIKLMNAICDSEKTYVPFLDLQAALDGKSSATVYTGMTNLRGDLAPLKLEILLERGQGYYLAKKE